MTPSGDPKLVYIRNQVKKEFQLIGPNVASFMRWSQNDSGSGVKMGKLFAFALLGLLLVTGVSASASTIKASQDLAPITSTSDEVVTAFNILYPGLELKVAHPASEEVLLNELEVLRDVLSNSIEADGQLIHLACCAPSCGGDKSCK